MRLSVLGGGSPFAAGLIVELAEAQACDWLGALTLHGRDAAALEALAAFASRRLPGLEVIATDHLRRAVEGADAVLHQIRYGGLEGRAADEAYCRRLGVAADEGLGPGGFRAALRMREPLETLSGVLAEAAPQALVINLTNPLSLSTSLMRRFGVARVVGACELPEATAARLSGLFGQPLAWDYAGFNHRGFLYDLRSAAAPVLPRLKAMWPADGLDGIGWEVIERLGAVPTKYFRLFLGGAPVSQPGRAAALQDLRRRILAQLQASADAIPPALGEREQPWWRLAVAPLLRAVALGAEHRQVLNLPDAAGVTRETWCELRGGVLRPLSLQTPLPAPAAAWLAAFERHELACLEALEAPTPVNLAQVREADLLRRLPVARQAV